MKIDKDSFCKGFIKRSAGFYGIAPGLINRVEKLDPNKMQKAISFFKEMKGMPGHVLPYSNPLSAMGEPVENIGSRISNYIQGLGQEFKGIGDAFSNSPRLKSLGLGGLGGGATLAGVHSLLGQNTPAPKPDVNLAFLR